MFISLIVYMDMLKKSKDKNYMLLLINVIVSY